MAEAIFCFKAALLPHYSTLEADYGALCKERTYVGFPGLEELYY